MFKFKSMIIFAASVKLSDRIKLRRKTYKVIAVDKFSDGTYGFLFQNIYDPEDCLQVADVDSYTPMKVRRPIPSLMDQLVTVK